MDRAKVPLEYLKAGEIASKVVNNAVKEITIGDRFIDVCTKIEDNIKHFGGEPAFPCNICVNDVTAHYTSTIDDEKVIYDGDVVKIDLGVHIDGYIADTARTISFNPDYDIMVNAAEMVLEEALGFIKAEVRSGDVGRLVSDAAQKWGFRPISNLSGHLLKQYQIHGGLSIPNIWVANTPTLKSGEVYAIEPFITTQDGAGMVVDDVIKNIFALISRKKTGEKDLDFLMEQIWKKRRSLPFAARWFIDLFDIKMIDQMLNKLVKGKIIRAYPVLVEAKKKPVAQFEHTFMPTESGVMILTR
jgi:methionyl aminopeptidase